MRGTWRQGAAGLLAAFLLGTSASAGCVQIDGQTLPDDQAWVEGDTSYITLAAFSRMTGRELSWDGQQALLLGRGLELTACPGELYILSNDRALYVENGVQVIDGQTVLPLRVLAQSGAGELTWDGDTDTACLTTTSAQPERADYDQEDLYWLSRIISAESRGEPLLGQIAVGNVVLNRVASSKYPDTIQEVVFDSRYAVQFEPVANGTIYDEPTQSAVLAAKLCLEGANVVGDSLYFFAPSLSAGSWIVKNATYYTTIGCHQFYLD